MVGTSLMKNLPGECLWTSLMISQHWFRWWLGVVRQQAITWANVDPDLCHHMVSLGHNELRLCDQVTTRQTSHFMILLMNCWFSFPTNRMSNTSITPQHQTPHSCTQDDVIKWRHFPCYFPCYWPFVRGIHWLPVNSPHKDQWHGALMFSLVCAWTNGWVNNRAVGDMRPHRAHYDVRVMASMNLVSGNCYGHKALIT